MTGRSAVGEGMLLKPQPLFEAVEAILSGAYAVSRRVVLAIGAGKTVYSGDWRASMPRLMNCLLICGRYEGVDERSSRASGR